MKAQRFQVVEGCIFLRSFLNSEDVRGCEIKSSFVKNGSLTRVDSIDVAVADDQECSTDPDTSTEGTGTVRQELHHAKFMF